MTGAQILTAYSEIAKNDLFPVITIPDVGVDEDMAMLFINLGAERVMRLLRVEAIDTFNFVSGTSNYGLETATGTRFFEISNVQVSGGDYPRTSLSDNFGWTVIEDQIHFNEDFANGTVITLRGNKFAPEIDNNDSEIVGIHRSCQLAIAQFAVVESCVAHESNPDQLERLQRLETTAEDACQRHRNSGAMSTFPSSLTSGAK